MTTPGGRPGSAGTCSSRARRTLVGLKGCWPVVLFAVALVVAVVSVSCSPRQAPRPSPSPGPPSPPAAIGLPARVSELLTKSPTDSCAICTEERRREAFEELDTAYPPGSVWTSPAERPFVRVAGAECELTLGSSEGSAPTLSLRFHTAASHLIGIVEADFTDDAIARRFQSIPEGARLRATLEIIAYAYGGGAAFLYSPARNHVQIQCRLLTIAADE